MASKINRHCPFCNSKLVSETYKMKPQGERGGIEHIVYCDDCGQFCTDSTSPSRVHEELKCIEK